MNDWKRNGSTAERLREAMQFKKVSQGELSNEAGLSKSSISRYLAGHMEPKSGAISKMAQALNVSEMWLWGYDVPMHRTSEQKKNDTIVSVVTQLRKDPDFLEVVSLLAELPAEQYDSVKTLLTALGKK